MYICARGRLQVVDTDGKTVLATLKAGSYFGEISILNMGTAGERRGGWPAADRHIAGNRRTASVCSVGYSDLFVLSKKDMWDVLKDYPAARVRLEAVAAKKIERYKKVPLEKGQSGDVRHCLMSIFSRPGPEPVHPWAAGERGPGDSPGDVGLSPAPPPPPAPPQSRLHPWQVSELSLHLGSHIGQKLYSLCIIIKVYCLHFWQLFSSHTFQFSSPENVQFVQFINSNRSHWSHPAHLNLQLSKGIKKMCFIQNIESR